MVSAIKRDGFTWTSFTSKRELHSGRVSLRQTWYFSDIRVLNLSQGAVAWRSVLSVSMVWKFVSAIGFQTLVIWPKGTLKVLILECSCFSQFVHVIQLCSPGKQQRLLPSTLMRWCTSHGCLKFVRSTFLWTFVTTNTCKINNKNQDTYSIINPIHVFVSAVDC